MRSLIPSRASIAIWGSPKSLVPVNPDPGDEHQKGSVRLTEGSYWTWLACGTLDVADRCWERYQVRYRKAHSPGISLRPQINTFVSLKMILANCQRGKQCSTYTRYSGNAVDLNWSSDGRNTFKDLLNPTVMLSIMKTESGGKATDIVYRVVTILEFQSWYGDPRKYSRKYSCEDFDQVFKNLCVDFQLIFPIIS